MAYQSRELTLRKLDEYLERSRKRGRLMLPAERELAVELGCGRGNVRELLAEKEALGEIVKKSRGRALSIHKVTGGKVVGNFAFVSGGDGMIGNPAWAKLWSRVQDLSAPAGLGAELILASYHDDLDEVLRRVADGPETMVFANSSCREQTERILALPGKRFVVLDEQHASPDVDLVTVDNYEAGKLAAHQLKAHGYRKPALVCQDMQQDGAVYKMFARRAAGFRDGCRSAGLDFGPESEIWYRAQNALQCVVRLIRMAAELRSRGFDSVFLHTDEQAPYLYQALLEEGERIPEEMGLVTVNSFNLALNHQPRIASVSHATNGVAERLVAELKRIFVSGGGRIGNVFVKPSFHEGGTLK